MSTSFFPSTDQVREVFDREVRAAGGTVADVYADGDRLFARAVLTVSREVLPGDWMNAGVALRAAGDEILVHPYVFRQVCRNGAIIAQAVQTRHVPRSEGYTEPAEAAEALTALQEAVVACCAPEAFHAAADAMRSAREREVDLVLTVAPLLSRLPRSFADQVLRDVFTRFSAEGDRSRFGLMNAVTSVARDTRDPQHRWDLEEFGGGIAADLLPELEPDEGALALRA